VRKIGELVQAEEVFLPSLAFNMYPELYDSNSGDHFVFHKPMPMVLKEHIHQVRDGKYEHAYAVKRIPREINHPLRKYVNELVKND
jgi:hypothetical protein